SIDESDFAEQLASFKESYVRPDEEHPENNIDDGNFFFAQKLLRSLMKNIQSHEELIKAELKREHLEGLEKVERSTLLIGIEELINFDTPYQVVLNELVNLAKKYGGEKSGQFVNGVLDGIRAKKC
ncbi:MAG: transcription antitermination protein NusB, partial [Halobacteriovoraceae bacterium]|nr:transcription antitermination protein NusB [Halobacteriovoraceae bacterium]